MRIYRERIPGISSSVVKALSANELIEVEPDLVSEVELDVGSVLKEYRRVDYELSERAFYDPTAQRSSHLTCTML